jgi:hypothetical protein
VDPAGLKDAEPSSEAISGGDHSISGASLATFGRYLLERGVLGRAQLEDATQVMVVFGGRLGTILVESGLLGVEEVEVHLARHLGVPSAPPDRLLRPDPAALRQVGRDLARRYEMLPMWIEKRRLHVAMLDPANPDRVDAVGFAVGLSVVPYTIAERRLVQLLEDHYGIRPDARFTDANILELAGHVRSRQHADDDRWEWAAPMPAAAGIGHEEDELADWRDAHGLRPLAEGEELSNEAEFTALHATHSRGPTGSAAAAPAASNDPARSATERAALEADLAMTGDRDSVVPTALRIAASYARVAAVFAVRDGMIQGVLAARGSASDPIDGLYVPAAEPSMLSTAARGGVFHGAPAREGIDAIVARLVGGGEPREAAIVPVAIRGKIMQILYVDNGPDPLPPSSLSALGSLCDGMSSTYGRLIDESTRLHC